MPETALNSEEWLNGERIVQFSLNLSYIFSPVYNLKIFQIIFF